MFVCLIVVGWRLAALDFGFDADAFHVWVRFGGLICLVVFGFGFMFCGTPRWVCLVLHCCVWWWFVTGFGLGCLVMLFGLLGGLVVVGFVILFLFWFAVAC